MTADFPDITFSVKMRLGITDPDEWQSLMPAISLMPLSHLTVHPRTASQQYSGQLHLDSFEALAIACPHPLVFNGEITTPQQIDHLRQLYPTLSGIMLGRGLLRRPSLIAEWNSGSEWTLAEIRSHLLRLHEAILDHYTRTLSGDTRFYRKSNPSGDYFADSFDRKTIKNSSNPPPSPLPPKPPPA